LLAHRLHLVAGDVAIAVLVEFLKVLGEPRRRRFGLGSRDLAIAIGVRALPTLARVGDRTRGRTANIRAEIATTVILALAAIVEASFSMKSATTTRRRGR
jgi:hypothetical protein